MKIAVIDLGTNTFHLLVGEKTKQGYQEVFRKRIYVQLGEGGFASSRITAAAQARAIEAMLVFKELLHEHNIHQVHAVATSAIRNADNGAALIARIQAQTGMTVTTISGAEEATLIYQGVKHALPVGLDMSLIMDIGGGSVEFILCNDQKALWEQSFEIGAQRLLDRFHNHDPILPAELMELETYLTQQLQPLFQAMRTYQPTKLIGTSGAFGTWVAMHQAKNPNPRNQQAVVYELPLPYFQEIYQDMRDKSAAERLQLPGLANERIDMIVVSSALIQFVLHKSNIARMLVSSYSLKVGLFLQALEKAQQKNNLKNGL